MTSSLHERHPTVEEAATETLRRFEKTFIDLARYDRGEKALNRILH